MNGQVRAVTSFSATNRSAADVGASPDAVWAVLTDPEALVRLTPLLVTIDAHGERWTWHLQRIKALGVGLDPVFTEAMTFETGGDTRAIRFQHAPPAGARERVGAEGSYLLTAAGDGSHLEIDLTISVDLPLPKASRVAVRRVMATTMARMGDRFGANLLRELGA